MFKFREILEKGKKEYLEQILIRREVSKRVVIYGAGKVGKTLYNFLYKEHIHVDSFCVTNRTSNKKTEYSIPVLQIDELDLEKDNVLFLIGVKKPWNKEIIETLKQYNFNNFIDVPNNVEFFDEKELERYCSPALEITPKVGCSVQCKFCPQNLFYSQYFANSNRDTEISLENFKKCIDKTPINTIIEFAGFVEPFLNKHAAEMMIYAHKSGRKVTLFTTLVGMSKKDFYAIKDIPFLEVVLHTPDIDGYANIPLTKDYFEVLELVISAKKPDGTPFVDKANCQSVPHPKIVEYTNGRLMISSELIDRAGNLEDSKLYGKKGNKGKLYCKRAYNLNHNVLLPDGTVVLCCMDFSMQHTLGNLLVQSYEDIMHGNEMQLVINALQDDSAQELLCRNCSSAEIIKM